MTDGTDVSNKLLVPDPPRGRSTSVSSRRVSLSSQLRYSCNLSDGDSDDDEDVSLLAFVVDEMMSVRLGTSSALSARNPPPKSSLAVFDSIPMTPFRDFLRIPLQVERFLVYATLNCWNLVLYDLTFGPLQVGVALDYWYPFQAARSFVLLLKAVAWLTKKRVRM
ncbi:MAG: uncharacterized protein KVP18_003879 [Porospora cf. gigantea A]|nr:MAG: hypothetical protein KVP18_003879 [Porospora cf. gigantea A]